ncbi:hypothetical protein BDZ91DRAFT_751037 [Kalaharituber pfeilii]|nr:hypothetical protein BDZ91DRAFT_751037 [Kalaharituber pfeilii]
MQIHKHNSHHTLGSSTPPPPPDLQLRNSELSIHWLHIVPGGHGVLQCMKHLSGCSCRWSTWGRVRRGGFCSWFRLSCCCWLLLLRWEALLDDCFQFGKQALLVDLLNLLSRGLRRGFGSWGWLDGRGWLSSRGSSSSDFSHLELFGKVLKN